MTDDKRVAADSYEKTIDLSESGGFRGSAAVVNNTPVDNYDPRPMTMDAGPAPAKED